MASAIPYPLCNGVMPLRSTVRLLLTAGLLALGYGAYVVIDAKAYQAIEQRRFEHARRDAPAAPALVDGESIGRD